MPIFPDPTHPSNQPLPGAIEAAERNRQDPTQAEAPRFNVLNEPVRQHVYQGVGTVCDWCNLPKDDGAGVHIPPPPNPANEPPGPPAQDPEPVKTPWFLRDDERADYTHLRSRLYGIGSITEEYDDLTQLEIMSLFTEAAAAIARLLEADLENRKELERLTGEAQTLMNTIAREPEAGDGPPELDPAAFYRSPDRKQPGPIGQERRSLAPEIETYCKDLLALSEQTLQTERRHRRELAEEFRRYVYDQARVNSKAIALIEDASK